MRVVKMYDQIGSNECENGTYLISTINGSMYMLEVPQVGITTMRRLRHAIPVDEEQQALSLPLYGDESVIPLWEWHAIRGGYGATFIFYAEGARKCEDVEDYPGTVRRTSPVTAIARVADA